MKKKLFISLFLCVLCFFVVSFKAYASSEVYVTAGNADYSSIELSKSVLNKAKSNCTKKSSNFKSTQTISESYQVHIYHFEAPSSGYYAFYTTGSKDTLINVYEHQNFILGILLAGADPVTSLSVSVIGSIISYAYSASENDAYSMMVTLNELCGVECYGSGWTADHGLVIEDFYIGTILGNNYYFYSYDNDLLVGDKYAKGSWSY